MGVGKHRIIDRGAIVSSSFVDENGNPYGIKQVENKPRFSSTPYLYDIAEGNIEDHRAWSKIGYNGDVDNSEEDMWPVGGIYVWPSTPMQMEVISSSSDDTATGTGARSINLYYLDNYWEEQVETITLNGAVTVTTIATDIYRVQNMRVASVGTGLAAAGNIDIRNLADTPIYGRISQGHTRMRQCIWTVPLNMTLFVTSIRISVGHNTGGRYAKFTTRTTWDDKASVLRNFFTPFNELGVQDSTIIIPLEIPTKLPEMTDLKVSVISDASNADAICSCALRGWLEW